MKLLIEIDLDKIHAAEPDDVDAAEGLIASLLHRAAGRIVKDGVPELDGLAFALRHDGETMGKMSRVVDAASLEATQRLANIANVLRQIRDEEYGSPDELAEMIHRAFRQCEEYAED